MRAPSASSSSTGQSPALLARIEEKKAELESLRELRDLSAAVAEQMEALEKKLSTLSDGTEAIAVVMGNWHNVLRAINMASSPKLLPTKVKRWQGLSLKCWFASQRSTHLHYKRKRRLQKPLPKKRNHDWVKVCPT
ncbi:DASH complex subunit dad2 [Neonectria punicea]|uniref:DASH complex subunit DAD2 n=1 Tax=Neonectria punicea TaxID=979145 RepID=A0ABR1HRR8_9HYPO